MNTKRTVVVHVELDAATYRALLPHCERLGVQVGPLITELVEKSVRGRQTKPKRPYRRISDETRALILQLAEAGVTRVAIAAQVDVSVGSIHNVLTEARRAHASDQ